mmetsp:Transcript_98431/g.317526  ORF Transcript_98431/g.317526 Transcript_98431/m.317526 type:complete len:207 (-) Transcript_98431:150-770(-)
MPYIAFVGVRSLRTMSVRNPSAASGFPPAAQASSKISNVRIMGWRPLSPSGCTTLQLWQRRPLVHRLPTHGGTLVHQHYWTSPEVVSGPSRPSGCRFCPPRRRRGASWRSPPATCAARGIPAALPPLPPAPPPRRQAADRRPTAGHPRQAAGSVRPRRRPPNSTSPPPRRSRTPRAFQRRPRRRPPGQPATSARAHDQQPPPGPQY